MALHRKNETRFNLNVLSKIRDDDLQKRIDQVLYSGEWVQGKNSVVTTIHRRIQEHCQGTSPLFFNNNIFFNMKLFNCSVTQLRSSRD